MAFGVGIDPDGQLHAGTREVSIGSCYRFDMPSDVVGKAAIIQGNPFIRYPMPHTRMASARLRFWRKAHAIVFDGNDDSSII